jgi:hypothetical protein
MFRYGLAAALTVSGVAFAHSTNVLDRTGLLGSCTALVAAAPNNSRWVECRPGVLTGYPDLSRDACSRGDLRGEVRYWICPTPLTAAGATNQLATR